MGTSLTVFDVKVLDGDHRNAEMKKMLQTFFETYRPFFLNAS